MKHYLFLALTLALSINVMGEDNGTTLNLKDFNSIENNYWGVKMIFTQGDSYSVRAVNYDSKKVDIYVKKNTLVVNNRNKDYYSMTKVSDDNHIEITNSAIDGARDVVEGTILYVTAPFITHITSRSAFVLEVNGEYKSNLTVNNEFGDFYISGQAMSGDSLNVKGNGNFSMNVPLNISDIIIKSHGSLNVNGNIHSDNVNIESNGSLKLSSDIQSKKMDIENYGSVNGSLSFKGNDFNIENYGSGDVSINVDCKSLRASSYGASQIKITGHADNTDVDSDGVDTSELNKD